MQTTPMSIDTTTEDALLTQIQAENNALRYEVLRLRLAFELQVKRGGVRVRQSYLRDLHAQIEGLTAELDSYRKAVTA